MREWCKLMTGLVPLLWKYSDSSHDITCPINNLSATNDNFLKLSHFHFNTKGNAVWVDLSVRFSHKRLRLRYVLISVCQCILRTVPSLCVGFRLKTARSAWQGTDFTVTWAASLESLLVLGGLNCSTSPLKNCCQAGFPTMQCCQKYICHHVVKNGDYWVAGAR